VAAVVRADQTAADPDPRTAQVVLERLVRIQKPASYYATTVVRAAGRPEVHLAFEDKGDARKLAATMEAEATNTHPGWATEWTLQLDSGVGIGCYASGAKETPKAATVYGTIGSATPSTLVAGPEFAARRIVAVRECLKGTCGLNA
jgi:hypothetical protein